MVLNRPLRVLAICHEDPEWLLGGMGRHVGCLYEAMARRGDVEVDLLTAGPGEGCKTWRGFRKHQPDKLMVYKPPQPDCHSLRAADWQMAMTLTQLLAAGHRWDVVHEHEWTSVQLGHMASRALGVPLVGTMHLCITKLCEVEDPSCYDNIAEWPEDDHYLRNQEGRLVSDPDRFIACSNAYARIIRETFGTPRHIDMIYNGIDTEVWRPVEPVVRAARGRPQALFVGRIATMKGIIPLLDAVEREDLGWKVTLVGEVNANSEAEREAWDVTRRIRRIEKRHPERLEWQGFRSEQQQLRSAYLDADCVIMPSTHEPFGIVALEAMACGTPLLCTEVDGLGEIVVDEAGSEYALIIPPGDPNAIAAGLGMMRKPEVRTELRELGLRRVNDFSWDVVADQTLRVYHEAIGARMRRVS